MFAALILLFIYAVFLKVAIGVATSVADERNTLGRAFFTAAILSVGQLVFAKFGILLMLWPIAWLFILKRRYSIGWVRAILVWLALVLMTFAVVTLVLVPMGLMTALTLGALTHLPW